MSTKRDEQSLKRAKRKKTNSRLARRERLSRKRRLPGEFDIGIKP